MVSEGGYTVADVGMTGRRFVA
ncbi:hypothetical protein RHRU231_540017 [Rhodococcus ruber]|uniref:Uncharacterized protein n=1 Tax=Rhodococcus ruber TaxID=1830 RepID=A0A098BN75_9NOCA|nr:hypothetical protein RHRU231_540017 [Rhodococcus ruber]